MKPKFATPGQRQMWIDAIMNVQTLPLPSEYDSETWDEVPSESDEDAEISSDELEDILSDEDLSEEALDEISKKTLGSYVKKASQDVGTFSAATGRHADRANKVRDEIKSGEYKNYAQGKEDEKKADKFFNKSWKRREGIAKAVDKLTKEETIKEADGDLAKGQVKVESDMITAKNQYGKTKTWMWDTKKDTPRFKNNQALWTKETTREAKKFAKGLNEEAITEGNFDHDPRLKSIHFNTNGYDVHGLYKVEYDDLFYKIWIEADGETVYTNDYGKETHNVEKISDDLVDQYLDDLITYAMEADDNLHESFEFVEEDIISEDAKFKIVNKDKGKNALNFSHLKFDSESAAKFKLDQLKKKYPNEPLEIAPLNEETLEEGVAETILSQLGGSKFLAMTGAQAWTKNANNIAFKIPKNKSKATRLKITLNGKDLYDMEFANQAKLDYKVIKTFNDVDAESLRKVFTDYTGMHTSLREETLDEDVNNITMLQNFKGNKTTLKFKNGDTIDVASDEAKIIAKRYSELKGDLQKKFADMLNKNSTSFLLAYKDAYKD